MKKLLLKFFFPLVLILISAYLSFKNYTPGTYFIGWDSMHSEFNFPLNFERMIGRVWSAEQGVGAIAAHSDMADLPRIIFLWATSLILPLSFLRYFYIFICLILGPLGMYFFLKYVFQKENDSFWVYPSAFLGALFYLLNLGTLQNFYVPLEMFPTAFAFLPWLFYKGFRYLREGGKKNLAFFALIVILSSPMAYAATLAYASLAGLFIFLFSYSLVSSAKKIKLKRFFILGLLTLLLSSYWILPNIYSLIYQSDTIKNAQVNQLFSPEAFLRNADYGDINDVLIQKNFLFSWRNFDFQNGEFTDLLDVWIKHLANPRVLKLGYILSGLSVLGLVFGILKKEKAAISFIPVLLLTLFFLFNINPPLGSFYAYLYKHFSLFNEGFRMPFTKFSVLFEILMSFFFGYFAFILLTLKTRSLKAISNSIKIVVFVAITGGLIYFMLPAFSGSLIGQNIRKDLPGEYSQMFNWFNSNSEGRVALMPMNSKYGWEYRNWGYEGSGFVTYGIPNPVLYRDFDRWSKGNEDFYNEASFGIYNSDQELFENVLKKYQVKYLLLDESVINPRGTLDILRIPQTKQMLSASNHIKEVQKFGFITIYQTDFDIGDSFVLAPTIEYGDFLSKDSVIVSPEAIIKEDLKTNRGFPEAYNCDLEKLGKVEKSYIPDGILYRADNGGVSCDYLNYSDLQYSQAYILRILGENKEGRSLKIYLYNHQTQRMDLEELMPEGFFDKTYLIYPKNLDGAGYTLNFETRSFGRIASENILSKVEFYPASYTFKGSPLQGDYSIQNDLKIDLKIISVKKYGTWAYKVDTEGEGLMQLGQGFENGWVAFQIPHSRFQILDHKMVSGWANGWVLPSNQVTNNSVLIIFWPQFLEFFGLGIMGITALSLFISSRKPH